MILTEKQVNDLKHLLFDRYGRRELEQVRERCEKCSYIEPNKDCVYLNLCERCDEFNLKGGQRLIIKDLIDTIEFLTER